MSSAHAAQALTRAQAVRLATAFKHVQDGDLKSALAIAWALASEAPDTADSHHLLAVCLAEDGQPVLAEGEFRRALELAPEHPLILVNYGNLLKRGGDFARAASCFAAVARQMPELAKGWQEFGLCMLELGDAKAAQAALEKAQSLQPEDAGILVGLAAAQQAQDELEQAAMTLERATSLQPELRAAWANLGACRRLQGRADQALACYRRALEGATAAPELQDALTGALLDTGQLPEALDNARRLVASFPAYVPGYVTLAHLHGEFATDLPPGDAPLGFFERGIRAQPGHFALRLAYARLLLAMRKPLLALEQVRWLRRQGDSFDLAQLEAEALDEASDKAAATALFAQLASLPHARSSAFLTAQTRHLLRTGRYPEAESAALQALELHPGNQDAWAYLGTLWRLLDDPREHWLCDYERLVTLSEVPVPAEFDGHEDFLQALTATLEPLHVARREPLHQSLRQGSQTPGRLFGRNDPVLAATHRAMLQAVEAWLPRLGTDPRHPFLARKADSVRVAGSWSVKLWRSGRHVNHIHPEGWLSSAFYVALPPSVTDGAGGDAGCIQFGQPPDELGLGLPPRRVIRPQAGKLALFPSYLWHGTVPFDDETPRMTIAFDMQPVSRSTP